MMYKANIYIGIVLILINLFPGCGKTAALKQKTKKRKKRVKRKKLFLQKNQLKKQE